MMRLLIAEDNKVMRKSLKATFESLGHSVNICTNGLEAIESIRKNKYDCIITDYKMPEADGMEVLLFVRETSPKTPVILITAFGDVEKAVEAMKCGAKDYITKPFAQNEIVFRVNKVLEEIQTEIISLPSKYLTISDFIGESPEIKRVKALVESIKDIDSPILITGETGTGKNLLARIIHDNSKQKDKPFVTINCSYMPSDLLGSELFGHEKGAFTGAIKQKKGLFEIANGGVAFLDEIGTMDLRTQASLLRLIQDKEFERVGGTETIVVDVHIIAATNINIQDAIKEKRFREDLFYRLNVINIHLPPLRDRFRDVLLHARNFLDEFNQKNKSNMKFEEDYESVFLTYLWPGNIRELQNVIERVAILAKEDDILNSEIKNCLHPGVSQEKLDDKVTAFGDLTQTMERIESKLILKALIRNNWNQSKAAEDLGIGRTALIYKMKKYDIKE